VDAAVAWLERAVDEQAWYLRSPAFDILRDQPRLQALWKKVGPPWKPGDPPPRTPPSG